MCSVRVWMEILKVFLFCARNGRIVGCTFVCAWEDWAGIERSGAGGERSLALNGLCSRVEEEVRSFRGRAKASVLACVNDRPNGLERTCV